MRRSSYRQASVSIARSILRDSGIEMSTPEIIPSSRIVVCNCSFQQSTAPNSWMDAFREVKEFLRRCDGYGLVEKHGAEYGFVRNLCGSRMIFVVEAVSGIAVCGFKGSWPHWTLTSGCLADAILLVLWLPFAWLMLPRMLMLNAEAYAGRAWVTFLSLAETISKKPNSSVNASIDQSVRVERAQIAGRHRHRMHMR
jgi:hypothetical protein